MPRAVLDFLIDLTVVIKTSPFPPEIAGLLKKQKRDFNQIFNDVESHEFKKKEVVIRGSVPKVEKAIKEFSEFISSCEFEAVQLQMGDLNRKFIECANIIKRKLKQTGYHLLFYCFYQEKFAFF